MEKKMMVWSAMLLGLGLAIMVVASPSGEPQPPVLPQPAAEPAPPTDLAIMVVASPSGEAQPAAVPQPAAEPAPPTDLATMVVASEPKPPAVPQPAAESAPPTNDITCQQAVIDMLPCQPFLTAKAGADRPTASCCIGVQNVFQQASTTQIRRELCECFKKAAAGLGVKPERAKQIPDLCKIALKIPIDPKIDCSTINI